MLALLDHLVRLERLVLAVRLGRADRREIRAVLDITSTRRLLTLILARVFSGTTTRRSGLLLRYSSTT